MVETQLELSLPIEVEVFNRLHKVLPFVYPANILEDGTLRCGVAVKRDDVMRRVEFEVWPECGTIIAYSYPAQESRAFKPEDWKRAAVYLYKKWLEIFE